MSSANAIRSHSASTSNRSAKLRAIAAAAPDVVVTGNPGCLMQIGAGALLTGLDVAVRHPVELLDLAYRR